MLDALLSDAGITLSALDALAFTHGPGSFTGLRIGFGIVQGLAFGANLPVIALSTLQVMAQRAIRLQAIEAGVVIVPALDARMGELYWGAYSQYEGVAQALTLDALCPQESLSLPLLNTGIKVSNDSNKLPIDGSNLPLIGVGDGWEYQPKLSYQGQVIEPGNIYKDIGPDAEDLLTLAALAFHHGRVSAIENVQPVYLRNTVSWKKHQRLRPR